MNSAIRAAAAAAAGLIVLSWSTPASAAASTLFRITDLDLRDPHVWVYAFVCADFTDATTLGSSFNASVQDAIQGDTAPADGFLDLSYVLEFLPLDQAAPNNALRFGNADCTAPMETSTCLPLANGVNTTASLDDAMTCLEPLVGTLRPYVPAVVSSAAPCFVGAPQALTISLAGIPLTLDDAQIAATFDATPASNLIKGLVRGFISEAVADATIIPESFPLIGGQPLSKLLGGGTGSCRSTSDKDSDGDTTGWWFYFNFVASAVPAERLFADDFELD